MAFCQPNPGSDDFLIAEDRSGAGYSSSSADDIICPFGRSGLVFSISNHDELRVSKRERSSLSVTGCLRLEPGDVSPYHN